MKARGTITTPAVLMDEYIFLREIGHGAYGVVHEAVHIKTIEHVAVKIVEKGANWESESSLMMQLHHRNVIRLREVKDSAQARYMVMDIAHGGELFDRLRQGPLDEATAAVVAKHILQAVAYVHEQGIIHRDIKPENILIGSPGGTDVVLADFGVAIKAGQAQGIVGSLQYLAPEALNGSYTKALDMWSVGVVLYSMLLGFPPFSVRASLINCTSEIAGTET